MGCYNTREQNVSDSDAGSSDTRSNGTRYEASNSLPHKLGCGLASRDGCVRNGRVRETQLEPEVLGDEVRTLLADQQRRRIRVRAEVVLHQQHKSAHPQNVPTTNGDLPGKY